MHVCVAYSLHRRTLFASPIAADPGLFVNLRARDVRLPRDVRLWGHSRDTLG
jgi:hypothetical protein